MSTTSLSNKLKKDVIQAISTIICKSFGPDNQTTLLCTSTGRVFTTCDGMTILEMLHLSHPVAKLVVDALRRHHCFTGDGTKTFFLYLSQAMMDLSKLGNQSLPLCLYNLNSISDSFWSGMLMQLMKVERDILPALWNELYKKSLVVTTEGCSLDHLKFVLSTSLSSQLSRYNSDLYERIILKSLTSMTAGSETSLNHTLSSVKMKTEFMLNNFDLMHLKLSKQSVDSSCILPGFLLRQDFSLRLTGFEESHPIRFVMLLCSVEGNTRENPSEIVHLKDEENACKAFSHRPSSARVFLKALQDSGASLIICSEKVPDYVLCVCREVGVSVISCVDDDDVHFIERVTGTQAVSSYSDFIDGGHIGKLLACERKVFGNKRFVHLEFVEEVISRIPQMIIIAAPTDGMVDQMMSVVYKAYKSVEMCFSFHNYSSSASGKNGHSVLINSDAKVHHVSTASKFVATGGGGFFEIQTANLLKKLSKNFSDSDTGLGCRMLHDSILAVPRSLHKHLSRNPATEAKDYMYKLQTMAEKVEGGRVVGFDRRGRICDPFEVGILEPLASKISAFASVVQLLQQIIKVDSIVNVRKLDQAADSNSDD